VARPPSKLYEFQKTVRRHKFGFAAATAISIVLRSVSDSTWRAVQATHAKQKRLPQEPKRSARPTSQMREQYSHRTHRAPALPIDINVAHALPEQSRTHGLRTASGRGIETASWEWRYRSRPTTTRGSRLSENRNRSLATLPPTGRYRLVHNDSLFVYDLQTRQEVAHLARGG
jgi:hypothetical protein